MSNFLDPTVVKRLRGRLIDAFPDAKAHDVRCDFDITSGKYIYALDIWRPALHRGLVASKLLTPKEASNLTIEGLDAIFDALLEEMKKATESGPGAAAEPAP